MWNGFTRRSSSDKQTRPRSLKRSWKIGAAQNRAEIAVARPISLQITPSTLDRPIYARFTDTTLIGLWTLRKMRIVQLLRLTAFGALAIAVDGGSWHRKLRSPYASLPHFSCAPQSNPLACPMFAAISYRLIRKRLWQIGKTYIAIHVYLHPRYRVGLW